MTPVRGLSLRSLLLVGMAAVAVVLAAVAIGVTRTTRTHLLDQLDDRLSLASAEGRRGRFLTPGVDGGELALLPPPYAFDGDGGDPVGTGADGDAAGSVGTGTGGDAGAEEGAGGDVAGGDPGAVADGVREPYGFGEPGEAPERLSDLYEGAVLPDGELTTFLAPNLRAEQSVPPSFDTDPILAVTDLAHLTLVDEVSGEPYRILARRFGDVVLVTASPLTELEETLSQLVLVQLVGSGVVLLMLGVVTWLVSRLGVRPLHQMTGVASGIAAGDLTVRVPDTTATVEASQLARALNRMLGRIQVAVEDRARSEERLRRFVADASHELRTPLTTIQGYAQLYGYGGLADPDALDDAMRRTGAEATRMARLVEEMLTLAKLDEERPLDVTRVDLSELARDAANDARARAPRRSVRVESNGPVVVDGDEDRLRQVLGNVIGNALVHTAEDAPIGITAGIENGLASLTVVDGGAGMAPDVVARVTERFYRADPSRSRATGGSGLGLAIVESVVAAHGGELRIRSEQGRGTAVQLLMPLAGGRR